MPEVMLSAENVSVSFGSGAATVPALDDVTLSFERGRLTLIMGPSGSGKTTLLSVLGCLLSPDRGLIRIAGQDVTGAMEEERTKIRRLRIGFVFQAFRLFRSLSALENVALALDLSGIGGRSARDASRQALADVGLADKWMLRPHELSGGEKQRVAIARALVNDPAIILADEPTASLDSRAGERIAGMLHDLTRSNNRLVVVVSHDPRWTGYSHRTISLRDGRVIEDVEGDR